jgi:hypothetical protein
MAYVGNPIDTQNTFQSLVGKRFNGDGSTTAFTLDVAPSSTLDIEVFVGNVRQDPNSAYTLSGTTLTFTGAPPSGTNNIYVVHQAKSVGTIDVPDDIISGKTLVTLDNSADHVLIEDATDGELKKALIPAASFAGIDDQSSSNDDQLTITDTAVVINEDSDDVDFRVESNGNANMLFVSGGNDVVGVGAEGDLGVGLHVKSADSGASVSGDADELVVESSGHGGITILTGNAHEGRINFGDDGDNDSGFFSYDHSANSAFIGTGGNNIRVKINSDGVMAIGTTSVSGSPSTSCLELKGTEAPLSIINETATDSSDRTSIAFRQANGTLVGNVGVDSSSTIFNTSSDYRLKENEVSISDGITRIKQLKPYKFNFKIQPDKTVDGFFAHEVSSIVPEAISGEKDATETLQKVVLDSSGNIVAFNVEQSKWTQGKTDGEYANNTTWETSKEIIKPQSIDQSKLVPLLTAALQEAITEIESLKARVTTLEE